MWSLFLWPSLLMPNSWTYTSLRFLAIILRGLRLEVSIYNVYTTNQFQTTFAQGGRGENPSVEVTVNSKEENSWDFCPKYVQEFGLWYIYCTHHSPKPVISCLHLFHYTLARWAFLKGQSQEMNTFFGRSTVSNVISSWEYALIVSKIWISFSCDILVCNLDFPLEIYVLKFRKFFLQYSS